jgi:23S rRNA pseudouridine1911/1915/1917 synthase
MSELHTIIVESATRLDQLLVAKWESLGRGQIREMVIGGAVSVNGRNAQNVGQRLTAGDTVLVHLPELRPEAAVSSPPGLALSVVYEDQALLVIDKPAGIPVRPSRKRDQAAVTQLLVGMYPEQAHTGGANRAGVVTTLGEDVSGLLLIGRDEDTYRELRRLVKRHRVQEVYTALVEGHLRGEFTIDQPIGNVKRARARLAVAREGRPARTFVRGQQHLKESGRDYTVVYVRPESARMHQIRVHLAWYGVPIVGDSVYGSRRQPVLRDRVFLHLSEMRLPHPSSGDEIRIESPLPPELYSLLTYMRRPK